MLMNKIRLDDEIVDIIQEVSNKIKEESGLPDIVKNTIFTAKRLSASAVYVTHCIFWPNCMTFPI